MIDALTTMVEKTPCNATHLDFTMFCCIGHTFRSLSVQQLADKSRLLKQMHHCFTHCHSSSHMTLVQEMMNSLEATGNGSTWRTYDLRACVEGSREEQCGRETKGVYVICLLVLAISLVTSLLGNLAVVTSILNTRKLRNSPTGMFILSLACSDLLITLLIVPLKVDIVAHNLFFCQSLQHCRAYITLDNILFVASITNLFALTVDRYMGLQYGFGFTYATILTKNRVRTIVFGIWAYAVAWGCAANVDWNGGSAPSIVITENLECVSTNKWYITVVFVVVFYIPIAVMVFLYRKIFRIARRHATEIDAQHNMVLIRQQSTVSQNATATTTKCENMMLKYCCLHSGGTDALVEQPPPPTNGDVNVITALFKQLKSVTIATTLPHSNALLGNALLRTRSNCVTKASRTVVAVCGYFLVCWLPVSVLAIHLSWTSSHPVHPSAHIVVVDVLPVLHSTLNPFIYFMVNTTYRKALRRVYNQCTNMVWSILS